MSTGALKKLLVGSNNNDIMDFCLFVCLAFFFFLSRVPLMYMYDIRGQVTFFVHETSSGSGFRVERWRGGTLKKKKKRYLTD